MPRTWTPVKLRIVRVAVRTVFAVVALSVIGWLYLGPVTLQAPDDGEPLKCEPLGKSDLDSYYMANFSDYDTGKRILYYMDNEIMDPKKRFDTDTKKNLEQGWERGCQLAREGRRDLLMIVLVLSATVFLALGSPRPFPKLFKSASTLPDPSTPSDPSTPNDFSTPTLRDSSARTPSDSSPQGETAETDAAAPPESPKPPESPNR